MYLASSFFCHLLIRVSIFGVASSTSSAFISVGGTSLHSEARPPCIGAERSRRAFFLVVFVVVVVVVVVVVAVVVFAVVALFLVYLFVRVPFLVGRRERCRVV